MIVDHKVWCFCVDLLLLFYIISFFFLLIVCFSMFSLVSRTYDIDLLADTLIANLHVLAIISRATSLCPHYSDFCYRNTNQYGYRVCYMYIKKKNNAKRHMLTGTPEEWLRLIGQFIYIVTCQRNQNHYQYTNQRHLRSAASRPSLHGQNTKYERTHSPRGLDGYRQHRQGYSQYRRVWHAGTVYAHLRKRNTKRRSRHEKGRPNDLRTDGWMNGDCDLRGVSIGGT